MNISTIDLIVFIAYCLLILLVGLFVSRRGKGETQDASNYFLAGRGLAWWAIGASIIASNISAEQFVGMSGSGYAIGLEQTKTDLAMIKRHNFNAIRTCLLYTSPSPRD